MKHVLCVLALIAITTPAMAATTLNVPADYPTVSAAVTAAADGDTVLIADGTYTSAGDTSFLLEKSITIASVHGAATTIIDGSLNPGQWIARDANTTFRGLTFRNGKDKAPLLVKGVSTITECTFTHNVGGAGLGVDHADNAVIADCIFDHNSGNFGGGIDAFESTVAVSRSTFDHNTAGDGGAISLVGGSASLDHCTFTGNSAYFGGVAFFDGAHSADTATVRNSTITDSTGTLGGAFYIGANSSAGMSVTLVDSVISTSSAMTSGAVACFSAIGPIAQSFSAVNSTFYNNNVAAATDGLFARSGDVSLLNVIIVNDAATLVQSTAEPLASYTATTSNVHALDPQFVDATHGDFRIPSTSPAALTGTTAGAPESDILGRQWDGGVSMGAYAPIHPASLVLAGPTSVVAGAPFTLSVKVVDQFGDVFSGTGETIHLTSSDGSAALPADTALTNGVGALSITLNTVGPQTLHLAGDDALSADAAITVTAAPVADLTITMSHAGEVIRGTATYTIVVTNSGSAVTSGLVTVTVNVPGTEESADTALAFAGDGWSCDQTSASCTRSDPLEPGAAYPAITLYAGLALDTPASLTSTATVAGGGEANTSNDTASDTAAFETLPGLQPAIASDDGCNASGGSIELVLAAVALLRVRRRRAA